MVAWIIVLAVLLLSMTAVHMIPREAIEANARESVRQLLDRKQKLTLEPVGKIFILDTYTDELVMNMALSADTSDPLRAATLNYYYQDADGKLIHYLPGGVPVPGEEDMFYYGRYWHGHQLFLRPALVFASYNAIALFNICLGILLFVVTIVLIYRRLGLVISGLYGLFVLLSYFPVSMASFQYVGAFVLAFTGTIGVLLIKPVCRSFRWCAVCFFVQGALISCFDLLSFPLISLCYPGIIMCMMAPPRRRIALAVIAVACWGIGYAGFFVSKWLVGALVMDWGFVGTALVTASVRFGEMNCVSDNYLAVYILIGLSVMTLIGLVLCRLRRCRLEALLIFSALPVVWFLVLRNHSGWHFFFTWRILVASAFSLAVFYVTIIRAWIRKTNERITRDSGTDAVSCVKNN